MSRFIPVDRQTDYLLPPSVDEWLPDGHLARFVVDVVEQLDLSTLTRRYMGRGSKAHHPAVLLSLLIYGYATGVVSSRKIERATYDSVAFRYLAANTHPDHDTLATFRRRFLPELEQLFVQVLLLAREMKLLKLGTIALDGTKLKANASKHKALSYGHAKKLEAQFRAEVKALAERAESADKEDAADGMDIPAVKPAWRPSLRRRPRSRRAPRSGTPPSKPPIRKRWRGGRRSARPARSPVGVTPNRPLVARVTRIRSISPTRSRASCRSPARGLISATTPKPRLIPRVCW